GAVGLAGECLAPMLDSRLAPLRRQALERPADPLHQLGSGSNVVRVGAHELPAKRAAPVGGETELWFETLVPLSVSPRAADGTRGTEGDSAGHVMLVRSGCRRVQ